MTARLPHPGGTEAASAAGSPSARTRPALEETPPPSLVKGGERDTTDHDSLLRRLRELDELHREGVLTDEEFASAKKAVLARF